MRIHNKKQIFIRCYIIFHLIEGVLECINAIDEKFYLLYVLGVFMGVFFRMSILISFWNLFETKYIREKKVSIAQLIIGAIFFQLAMLPILPNILVDYIIFSIIIIVLEGYKIKL